MKTPLNAAALLALCLVALSAQTTPGPVVGAGQTPVGDQNSAQNMTLRLQGIISPNLPIDVTLTLSTVSQPSTPSLENEVYGQLSEAASDANFVPWMDESITLKPVPSTNTYSVRYSIPAKFDPDPLKGGNNLQGTVLLKPGQTVTVLDAPGENLQFTLTPAAN